MWCLVVSQHDLHGQYLPQSTLEKHALSQRNKLTSRPLARNGTKQNLRCDNQANELQLPPSLYPVNALSQKRMTWSQMRSLTYFLRSSSLNEELTVHSSFGDRELLSFVSFPREATSETNKKKHSLCCGRFQFILVVLRNTTTCRESETKTDQIDDEARRLCGSIVKTKHLSLTSLACMRRPRRQPSGPPYLHSVPINKKIPVQI